MQDTRHPRRSTFFRLVTIAASGLCSLVLGLWWFGLGFGDQIVGLPSQLAGGVLAALCAAAASLAAMSVFAGVDKSSTYVRHEIQIDKLTEMPSRAAIAGKIAEVAATTIRTGEPVFLIDVDIDRFKQINDSIGYGQGDQLVLAFARRLREILPENTEIGRIGAGEFAVLVPDNAAMGPVDGLADRLIEKLSEPYQLPSHLQSINVSVGIVAMPKDGLDPTILMRRSNLALQHARASGPGNWSVFRQQMGLIAEQRHWIESELHLAFKRGDFEVHYQPQFDLDSGATVGYEALVRWRHPERGMIPPGEFVPIAEETGIIGPIGEWVLRRACADARLLPQECFVAVNISPMQFMTRDFLALVREAIATSGIDPARLELEITETAMMQDRNRAVSILDELARMGISVAVDDFGTGYSNLSYLVDFTFKKLKIDQSFVRRMETDASAGAVVSTIVDLSRALGVRIIAEGVETQNQVALLKAAGCQVVQGYLFGRPEPLASPQRAAHSTLKRSSRQTSPWREKPACKTVS